MAALTRRDFLRSATVVSAGALTGVAAYGVAYERHRIEPVVRDVPVRGLPPALDGLRIGMITDVHHSAVVPADDVARAVAVLKKPLQTSSCWAATTCRSSIETMSAPSPNCWRRWPGLRRGRLRCWAITTTSARCRRR